MTRHYEAVITCVNYSDYLAETLPQNKLHFDWVVVVTANDDRETLELCRRLSIPCYPTGKFRHRGAPFNKGLAINHGLKYLRYKDWVAHIDADTVLTPSTGYWLRKKQLDPSKIYGVDRVNCHGWDRWQKWKQDGHSGHDYDCRVPFPRDMPILERISLVNDGGYVPIGYFQLWNIGASSRNYPVTEGTYATAERTDVSHATQWDEEHRLLLPEFYAIHLSPNKYVPLGTNWDGRDFAASPRFGPGV